MTVIFVVVAFLVGGAIAYSFFKYGLKKRYDKILKEAENEAEVIKKNKLLEKLLHKLKQITKKLLRNLIKFKKN